MQSVPRGFLPVTNRAWDSRVALQSQCHLGPGSTAAHLCKRRKGGASSASMAKKTAELKLGRPPLCERWDSTTLGSGIPRPIRWAFDLRRPRQDREGHEFHSCRQGPNKINRGFSRRGAATSASSPSSAFCASSSGLYDDVHVLIEGAPQQKKRPRPASPLRL
jgi:hypothetical protein